MKKPLFVGIIIVAIILFSIPLLYMVNNHIPCGKPGVAIQPYYELEARESILQDEEAPAAGREICEREPGEPGELPLGPPPKEGGKEICPPGEGPVPPPPNEGGKGICPPGGAPMPPASVKLSKEEEQKVESFVRENDPIQYKDLQEMKSKDEFMYNRIMADMFKHVQFLEKLKKDKPEIFKCIVEERKLESSCRELVKKIRGEKDHAKIQSIKNELRNNLSRMFDLRQKAKDEKLKDLERDLKALKAKNEERKKNKDKIVDYRLQEMVNRAEGLEW
jgi:hypothetical protein